MHQIVCRLELCSRPRVYSVYFVHLYILCNWSLAPLLQNRSSADAEHVSRERERQNSRRLALRPPVYPYTAFTPSTRGDKNVELSRVGRCELSWALGLVYALRFIPLRDFRSAHSISIPLRSRLAHMLCYMQAFTIL